MTRHDWSWTASGRPGSAGIEIPTATEVTSSGASVTWSRHRGRISPASRVEYITPAKATIGPSGWASKSKWVTTPKLPPPPRNAQNKSASLSGEATWTEPSAQTTVAARRLSTVSPYLRRTQPSPPPSVRPPTPVSETTPPGTTRPNACVSRSTSAHTAPPCTEARLAIGSTVTARIRVRSITTPPSQLDNPATE